jgi:hypothetical protein
MEAADANSDFGIFDIFEILIFEGCIFESISGYARIEKERVASLEIME